MPSKGNRPHQLPVVISALLLIAAAVVKARGQDAGTQNPPDNKVRILLTALDKEQQLVTLRAEDLRIIENGTPQKIVSFQQITDQPVSLAILIDTSASQGRMLPGEKLAATFFVNSIIQPRRDQAAVATFTEIGEELRTQYLIAYHSTSGPGASRKIQVEIVNPALRSRDIQLAYQRIAPRK